jgi:hypothetical protein
MFLADVSTDGELVALAERAEAGAALEALLLRLRPWMDACIAREAARAALPPEEVCDARQGAFLVLLRTLTDFDPGQGGSARAVTVPDVPGTAWGSRGTDLSLMVLAPTRLLKAFRALSARLAPGNHQQPVDSRWLLD